MAISCLVLACSPRKNGNTAILAKRALDACAAAGCKTDYLYLAGFNYRPCQACGGCNQTGRCVIDDDARVIYEKILAADRLIIAAPIFSMGICAQAKMLIDRAQQFWATKYLLKSNVITGKNRTPRRGIFISCAGTTLPGVFTGAQRVVQYFFKMLEIELLAQLCFDGVDDKGDILKHQYALDQAAAYGRILADAHPIMLE